MQQQYLASILLVEDEENLHETLKMNLEMEGYEVSSAFTGVQAINKIEDEFFDLVILDIMLPEMDGIQVTETIRVKQIDTSILILSAKNTGSDRILGLKKGADDYLTKPFELEELLLRVDNLIKKNKKSHTDTVLFSFGNNTINFKAHTAINFNGETIELSKKEAQLLKLLVENKNEVVTRERILQIVWGYNVYPTTRTIDNFILNFRKHFEENSRQPKHFFSVRGLGYKFMG